MGRKAMRRGRLCVAVLACFVGVILADTWIWSEPINYSPQPRFEHSANRIGNQLFVFGGTLSNNVQESDLHVLNMDSMKWSTPAVTGTLPPPTMGHATVVSSDQLFVLFGSDGKRMLNTVYQLDTDTFEWSRVLSTGHVPAARAYHSSFVVDGVVYTFGGFDGRFYLNDLHQWTIYDTGLNQTGPWKKLEQSGTIPEVRASAATAVYGRRMFLFGGFEVAVYKNDFFVLDLDTLRWSPIHLTTETSCPMPGPRAMASLTLVGTKLVLFGGIYCSSSGTCNELSDVHSYDIFKSEMQSKEASGDNPPARYGHSGTLFGSKVVVFGGAAWPNLYNDIFLYDVYDNRWTVAPNLPPYARKQHSLNLFYPESDSPAVVIFGGKHGSQGFSQHLHIFDINTSKWRHPKNDGQAPPALADHATAIKGNTTLFVFGGYNGNVSSNDVYTVDLESSYWEKVDADGRAPPPCHGHAIVTASGSWLQFGGVDCHGNDCTFYNQVFSLSHETLSWTKVETNGSVPRPRASHSWTTVSPTNHVLFGGIGPYFTNLNDMFVFEELGYVWSRVNAKGHLPAPRYGHVAVIHDGNLLVFGGASCKAIGDCSYFSDVFQFVFATSTWSEVSIQGSRPSARVGAAGAILGETVYLFGGATKDRLFSELLTIKPDPPVPALTTIIGDGAALGTTGKEVTFFVQLQDSFLVNRTTGGNSVSVAVVPLSHKAAHRLDGNPIHVYVMDNLNGQYKVSYTTEVAGSYNVTVTIDGFSLPPFTTNIISDLPSPNNTVAKGPGLMHCTAGEECRFSVELFDQFMNKLQRPSPLDVQFLGPKRVMKKVRDLGDGDVKVSYVPEKAGVYVLHLRLRAQDIIGSPFYFNVSTNSANAKKSRIQGDGLFGARAGGLGSFSLWVHDSFENPLVSGGDSVKAHLFGPDELVCAVDDHGNGTYSLSYTAVRTGTYRLNVVLNDEPVEGSPFEVVIRNSHVSAATTFAFGAGVRYSIAGYRAFFSIQSADEFGNNMTTGGTQLNVLFAGPGEYKLLCNVTDHNDGLYTASYTSTVAGDFMISATMWNPDLGFQSIHLSPYLGTTVAAGVDPTKSFIHTDSAKTPVSGVKQAFSAVMGVHNYFHIQAIDRYGNQKTTGGDRFSVVLEGPVTHEGFVSDNGDGTYVGTYVAPTAGKFWLKVFYGSVLVQGAPIPVDVRSNFENCPNKCSGHGDCKNDICKCAPGFSGLDCSVETGNCLANCLGNGACINNTCFCYPGFAGTSCEQSTTLCPNDCSKHGECVDAMCVCDEGYQGTDCSDNSATCASGCSGNGECVNGTCLCYPGFKGVSCSKQQKFCPKGCAGRGKCLSSGMCSCNFGWTGLDCSNKLMDTSLAQTKLTPQVSSSDSNPVAPTILTAQLPRRK
eukprot:c4667_g1_i1.p1 GENE.c4667_g1_i1~~c4667_g1_i1.p1  ORF type:complete len:1388 (-),score=244.67 c4667_g1_i1:88-4251(-)